MSAPAAFVIAAFRDSLAGYVIAVANVYVLLIIAYILSSMFFAFGGRVPYARWSSAVLGFLRDVCEPYLGVFRRFIPPLGPIDLSPIIAIILLRVVAGVVARVIQG
jgi:YggT family protein